MKSLEKPDHGTCRFWSMPCLPFAGLIMLALTFAAPLTGEGAVFDGRDSFDDQSKNTGIWGNDASLGIGGLVETNGHLHYRTSAGPPMNGDYSGRPWLQVIAATNDWEIRLLANVPDIALGDSQHYAFGLFVMRSGDSANRQVLMLGNESPNYTPGRSFYAISFTNSASHYEGEITTSVRAGLVRLRWNSETFQLASQFSTDGGKTWTNCGAPVANPWGIAATDWFVVGPAGYSENVAIAVSDNLYGDNFQTVGQRPVIDSIAPDGELTLTDSLTNAHHTIEWAPTVNGPWYRDWSSLSQILATNTTTKLRLPVFYRAVRD